MTAGSIDPKSGTDFRQHWVSVARGLRDILGAEAAPSEDLGTATPVAVAALRSSRLLHLMVPRDLGGVEADLGTWTEVISELAYADGSLGWTANANLTITMLAACHTGERAVKTIFDNESDVAAGQLGRPQSAVAAADGWIIDGQFGFCSGGAHATWIAACGLEKVDGEIVTAENGYPRMRGCFVHRDEVEWQGNWDVMGLRGTGSFDYTLDNTFVPEEFSFNLLGAPLRGPARNRLGIGVLGLAGHAGWSIGVARRAVDEALRAKDRAMTSASAPVGERDDFQFEIGRVDAHLRAARALALEVFEEAEDFIEHNEAPAPGLVARSNQAVTQCVRVALDAARTSFEFGGVRAIRNGVLERLLRDATVAAQHVGTTRDMFTGLTRWLMSNS